MTLLVSVSASADTKPVLCEKGEQLFFMGERMQPTETWFLTDMQKHVFSIDYDKSEIALGPYYARKYKYCGSVPADIDELSIVAFCGSNFSLKADRQNGSVEITIRAQGTSQPEGSTPDSSKWIVFLKNRYSACKVSDPKF